jgi:hypothetical protein
VDDVAAEFQDPDPHVARADSCGVEDTSNSGGRPRVPSSIVSMRSPTAHDRGARAHSTVPAAFNRWSRAVSRSRAARRASTHQSVCCFSKGLGAPLAPSLRSEGLMNARSAPQGARWRMRQVGLLAPRRSTRSSTTSIGCARITSAPACSPRAFREIGSPSTSPTTNRST